MDSILDNTRELLSVGLVVMKHCAWATLKEKPCG